MIVTTVNLIAVYSELFFNYNQSSHSCSGMKDPEALSRISRSPYLFDIATSYENMFFNTVNKNSPFDYVNIGSIVASIYCSVIP